MGIFIFMRSRVFFIGSRSDLKNFKVKVHCLIGPIASSRLFWEVYRWDVHKKQFSKLDRSIYPAFDMKSFITFAGISIADSILPATTCGTLNGDFGASLKCPYDTGYVVGFCSSGKNKDCVNEGTHSHQYKCCNEHEVSIDLNRCEVQYARHGFVDFSRNIKAILFIKTSSYLYKARGNSCWGMCKWKEK